MKNLRVILTVAAYALGISGAVFAVAQQPSPDVATSTPSALDLVDQSDAAAQEQSLNLQSHELLSQYRAATDSTERERLTNEIGKTVASQFDVRQRLREKELQQLADQLERLRNIHRQRAEQKDRIVKDHVEQLLRDADGLGWGDAPHRPRPSVVVPMLMDDESLRSRINAVIPE